MSLVNEIQERLQVLNPVVCVCEDESHLHAGHAGAKSGGGHYALFIVSDAFEGQSRIARQRMVNAPLQDLFVQKIHALSIRALTNAQWQDLQQKEAE